MPFRRQSTKWFQSLRVRLIIWHTLVVLLAVTVALLSVREGLRFYLRQESDVVLNDEAKELLLAIERWYPNREQIIAEMQQKAQGHADRGWHIRWLSPDRKQTIWASSLAPSEPLTRLQVDYYDSQTASSQYRVWVSQQFRSVERQLQHPRIPAFYVRVGAPTDFVNHDVARLTRIAGPVALGIFLLAPLGGYFLSARAVRPLQEIILTTERLRPSQLDERLPVRDVGDELDQLAGQINHFLDQIAEHLRRNRDFVANAAHDLRSPLAAILSGIEVTVCHPRTPEEYEDQLFAIQSECLHLTQLVNLLLQLTEADSGMTPDMQPDLSLSEIVRRTIDMLTPIAEERNVQLEAGDLAEARIPGNGQLLRQLVTNLIDNAIKFTPAGGRVTVRLAEDVATDALVLEVTDTGIGIPAVDLPRVFERFYQVDASRSRQESGRRGYGLGLSICQTIVQLHRGKIDVTSEVGQGTQFTVHIPRHPSRT